MKAEGGRLKAEARNGGGVTAGGEVVCWEGGVPEIPVFQLSTFDVAPARRAEA